MSTALQLRATPTFLREYRKASGQLAHLAEQEVHFLIERARSEPKTWMRRYDRVAGITEPVLELEVASGPRLLMHINGALTMCRLGDHEIVRRTVANQSLLAELPRSVPAPASFLPTQPSRLFPVSTGDQASVYGLELAPEWVHWLDEEQHLVGSRILEQIEDALASGTSTQHMVLGGPGTGKTTVLVWLLQRLSAAAPYSRESWDVRLVASDRFIDYLRRSTGWNLDDALRPLDSGSPNVVLIDDPASLRDLPGARGASCVVAVDPLQLVSPITDDDLASLTMQRSMHWLHACYRQKEHVGLAARHVIDVVAASSPFLASEKQEQFSRERSEVTQKSNAMTYPNPTGRVRNHDQATVDEWEEHVRWLQRLKREGKLWRHWPSILLVKEEGSRPPTGWTKRLTGLPMERIGLSEVEKVKGLEYQHVILLLTKSTYRTLNKTFSGCGKASYREFVRMRIPFTRAKDSIATFVV